MIVDYDRDIIIIDGREIPIIIDGDSSSFSPGVSSTCPYETGCVELTPGAYDRFDVFVVYVFRQSGQVKFKSKT